ncbi:hypothetical protein DMA11_23915 [Marinilabiliaceae bacterium JC017]|nr:hypothetical protein DMA11_23915 [Marinilabiliaceae bacterium JC017]
MAIKIINSFTLILICLIIFACSHKKKTEYQDDQSNLIQDSTFVCYFDSGAIKEKGILKDSSKIGLWKEWYSDGKLKWKGYFDENNNREINISQQIPDIVFNNTELEVGKEYLARIFVDGLHPKDMIITTKDNVSMFYNKENDYFKFKFRKNGTVILKVYAVIPSEEYYVGNIVLNIN